MRAADLLQAGATGLRLNGSHLTPDELTQAVLEVRDRLPELAITIDLQGGKPRLGAFEARELRAGERIEFNPTTLPHPEIFDAARAGDLLSVGDGQLRLRVLEVAPERLVVSAIASGRLSPRKGITLLDRPVVLRGLTQADQAQIDAIERLDRPIGDITWAISYLRDGGEVDALRRRLPNARVIGKIERPEAIAHLDAIARKVDALWICRGDLGEQIGPSALAAFVARFDPRRHALPTLMAGQVFEHLTEHAAPTRSEVCHLYDLLQRGHAGIVLSDETAVGRDPVRAVAIVRELIEGFGRHPSTHL
jgi:pyruvate kinase